MNSQISMQHEQRASTLISADAPAALEFTNERYADSKDDIEEEDDADDADDDAEDDDDDEDEDMSWPPFGSEAYLRGTRSFEFYQNGDESDDGEGVGDCGDGSAAGMAADDDDDARAASRRDSIASMEGLSHDDEDDDSEGEEAAGENVRPPPLVRRAADGGGSGARGRRDALIVLDWDDTLFPTSAIERGDAELEREPRLIRRIERAAHDVLHAARALGDCIILTNVRAPRVADRGPRCRRTRSPLSRRCRSFGLTPRPPSLSLRRCRRSRSLAGVAAVGTRGSLARASRCVAPVRLSRALSPGCCLRASFFAVTAGGHGMGRVVGRPPLPKRDRAEAAR